MIFQLLTFFVSKLDSSRRLIVRCIAVVSSFMAHEMCGLEMLFSFQNCAPSFCKRTLILENLWTIIIPSLFSKRNKQKKANPKQRIHQNQQLLLLYLCWLLLCKWVTQHYLFLLNFILPFQNRLYSTKTILIFNFVLQTVAYSSHTNVSSQNNLNLSPCSITKVFHYIIIHYVYCIKPNQGSMRWDFDQYLLDFGQELFFVNYTVVILPSFLNNFSTSDSFITGIEHCFWVPFLVCPFYFHERFYISSFLFFCFQTHAL